MMRELIEHFERALEPATERHRVKELEAKAQGFDKAMETVRELSARMDEAEEDPKP